MALAETDRRPKEQVMEWGFKILPPDDFDSFNETFQKLKPAVRGDKPHMLGLCNFLVPYPVGRVSVSITRSNGDAVLIAFISPSWLKGKHILNFIRQESDLKIQEEPWGSFKIIEGNVLMEAWNVVRGNNRDVFPPHGEQIIIQTEKIPIGDGWPLFEGLTGFSRCAEKIVDSVFAMTGKPCPLGKAISLGFPRELQAV